MTRAGLMDTQCTCKNDTIRLEGHRDSSDHLSLCHAHPNYYDTCPHCGHYRGLHAIWMWRHPAGSYPAGCFGRKCECPGYPSEVPA